MESSHTSGKDVTEVELLARVVGVVTAGEPRRTARLDAPAAYKLTEKALISENVGGAAHEVEVGAANIVLVAVVESGLKRSGSSCAAVIIRTELVVVVASQSRRRSLTVEAVGSHARGEIMGRAGLYLEQGSTGNGTAETVETEMTKANIAVASRRSADGRDMITGASD